MNQQAPVLEVKDLVVAYGAVEALHGVELSVREGEVVALVGANGAGKTTLLRTISGLMRPRRGSVQFRGRSMIGQKPHRIVRGGISHVPEGRGIFGNLTVAENLSLGAAARTDGGEDKAEREKVLQLFPRLRERMKQNAGTLSGGEQQMLAIARALLARPQLLLLDEPSLGLAPQLVQTIFQIIREINAAGTTILLVEQNVLSALEVATSVYVLETGHVAAHGKPSELANNETLRRAYLGG